MISAIFHWFSVILYSNLNHLCNKKGCGYKCAWETITNTINLEPLWWQSSRWAPTVIWLKTSKTFFRPVNILFKNLIQTSKFILSFRGLVMIPQRPCYVSNSTYACSFQYLTLINFLLVMTKFKNYLNFQIQHGSYWR
jgi:hypothetical protein